MTIPAARKVTQGDRERGQEREKRENKIAIKSGHYVPSSTSKGSTCTSLGGIYLEDTM